MSAARKDPFRNSRYIVEIDGIAQAGFSEAAIAESSSDPIEYREGNEAPHVRLIPGLNKHGHVTLKKGITDSMDIYNWYKAIVDGKINSSRKNMSILILNEQGTEAARYNFVQCWPTKYHAPDLNAKGNDIAIETLEIAHEGVQRAK